MYIFSSVTYFSQEYVHLTCSYYRCMHSPAYAITTNGACLHLLVPPLHNAASSVLLSEHNSMYYSINSWAYFHENSTLWNKLHSKMGGGLSFGRLWY